MADLRAECPEFLIRTPERTADLVRLRALRMDEERDIARDCRTAQARARKKMRRVKQQNARARKRALAKYRKLYGRDAPHPESPGADTEQKMVFEVLLSQARIDERHGG